MSASVSLTGCRNPWIHDVRGDKKHLQSWFVKKVGGRWYIWINPLFLMNYSYEPPTTCVFHSGFLSCWIAPKFPSWEGCREATGCGGKTKRGTCFVTMAKKCRGAAGVYIKAAESIARWLWTPRPPEFWVVKVPLSRGVSRSDRVWIPPHWGGWSPQVTEGVKQKPKAFVMLSGNEASSNKKVSAMPTAYMTGFFTAFRMTQKRWG